ncbi:MAG TPA: hypothetical protein VI485_21055 [Vicinamibacterales bacterium]|nr:hypothetical protein [Vicinamibacterales bacterium]
MRAARVFVAFAVIWSMQLGVSYALEDFLDKLSGPGPFWGFSLPYRFVCFSRSNDQTDFRTVPALAAFDTNPQTDSKTFVTWMTPTQQAAGVFPSSIPTPVPTPGPGTLTQSQQSGYRREQARRDCYIDQRVNSYVTLTPGFYRSFKNRLFPADPKNDDYKVTILRLDAIYTFRLNRVVDIGAGVGVGRFSGEVFNSFTRASVTPIYVYFAPLAFRGDNQVSRALRFGIGLSTYIGDFTASDFCNKSGVSCAGIDARFVSEKERLLKWSIDVDPVLLLYLFGKKPV